MKHQITCERAMALIEAFAGKCILVVGDVMLDHYVEGKIDRVNPEASVPLLDVEKTESRSGGAGNVAKNVAALGARAVVVGVVGSDQTAEELRAAAKHEGYDPRFIVDKSRPTTRKMRFLTATQPLLRVDHEERRDVDQAIEDELIAVGRRFIPDRVDGIIISDYAKGVVTERVGKEIVQLANNRQIPVAGDAKPARLSFVKGATLVSPNLKEAHEFAALYDQKELEIEALAKWISEKLDTTACITLGADGMYVQEGSGAGAHILQEHRKEVFDVSGAGDTAITALLLARLAGATFTEAATLANAAGAVAVSQVGSVGVKADELRDMICHQHE